MVAELDEYWCAILGLNQRTSGLAHQQARTSADLRSWYPCRDVDTRDLLSHLASDETFSEPGINNAPGIDLLTLSFVAIVDAIPLDHRALAM